MRNRTFTALMSKNLFSMPIREFNQLHSEVEPFSKQTMVFI